MKLDLFVNLKYESNTITLYSTVLDIILCETYFRTSNRRYASETVNDVNVSCGISSP